jgi:hypothetical protein
MMRTETAAKATRTRKSLEKRHLRKGDEGESLD